MAPLNLILPPPDDASSPEKHAQTFFSWRSDYLTLPTLEVGTNVSERDPWRWQAFPDRRSDRAPIVGFQK
jgi:hypothetical protein